MAAVLNTITAPAELPGNSELLIYAQPLYCINVPEQHVMNKETKEKYALVLVSHVESDVLLNETCSTSEAPELSWSERL